jgi:uncharacterized membrane protein
MAKAEQGPDALGQHQPGPDVNKADAAWGSQAPSAPRYPAILALLLAIVLYVTLPDTLTYGPRWLLPILEGVPLLTMSWKRTSEESMWERFASIGLIVIINAANLASLVMLLHSLLQGKVSNGRELIFYSMQIWFTNVLVFGLWYWELDRGGPGQRCHQRRREPDFLFPQMANPQSAPANWYPSFLDYLYVSFTNATAFSPTDTMPLTEWAKVLTMVQSLASLLTVGLVAARAVNILK